MAFIDCEWWILMVGVVLASFIGVMVGFTACFKDDDRGKNNDH